MRRDRLLMGWMLLIFLMGCVLHSRDNAANAAAAVGPPNPCPQFQCVQLSYLWTANTGVTGVFEAGTNTVSTDAYSDVFTTSSTWDQARAKTGNKIDVFFFPSCSPQCGKDLQGVWQAPQAVAPSGAKTKASTLGAAQFLCAATKNGAQGTTNAIPVNDNPNKQSPP